MARISGIVIKQEPQHYMLALRKTIDFMKEYAAFAEQALTQTEECLRNMQIYPMSGPVVCFHNTDLAQLDVEIGWQITQPVQTEAGVWCSRVEPRKVVTTIDQGPYEEQDPTLMELMAWVQAQGYELEGPILYCYLNDAERPEAELLTQMSLLIRQNE